MNLLTRLTLVLEKLLMGVAALHPLPALIVWLSRQQTWVRVSPQDDLRRVLDHRSSLNSQLGRATQQYGTEGRGRRENRRKCYE
jgi:hypothetical protein